MQVTFGLKFSAQGNVIVAGAAGEATLEVALTYRRAADGTDEAGEADAMGIDPRVAPYLGRVLDADGDPAGTCFQVTSGVLVTAWHVLDAVGAGGEGATVAAGSAAGRRRPGRRGWNAPIRCTIWRCWSTAEPLPGSVAGLAASDEVDYRRACRDHRCAACR